MASVLGYALTAETLQQMLSRADSSERITIEGTEFQALLTLAGQIRSPKAQKLKCLLDTLSQSEVTLAGSEFIMLLRLAREALLRQERFGSRYIDRVAPWLRRGSRLHGVRS